MSRRKLYTVRLTPQEMMDYRKPSFMGRLANIFAVMTVFVFIYLTGIFIAINWVSQCGEVVYHADGTWENGTCHPDWLFFNYEPKKGRWK